MFLNYQCELNERFRGLQAFRDFAAEDPWYSSIYSTTFSGFRMRLICELQDG
jgi:hypothetical protein